MTSGKVWLVGAGPGDIGLFTLKGLKVLEQADVVVYDSLVGQGILTRIPASAKLINVGKRAGHHTMSQEKINQVLADEAKKGNREKEQAITPWCRRISIKSFWKRLKKEIK